jgi:hypothetical protein
MHTSVNDLIRSLQQFPGDTPVIGVTLKGVASNVISVQCCAGIDPEKPNNCFICFWDEIDKGPYLGYVEPTCEAPVPKALCD